MIWPFRKSRQSFDFSIFRSAWKSGSKSYEPGSANFSAYMDAYLGRRSQPDVDAPHCKLHLDKSLPPRPVGYGGLKF